MHPKVSSFFDNPKSELLGRRDFLKGLAGIAGGSVAASALFPQPGSAASEGQMVPEDDSRLETSTIEVDGETGKVLAYFARPKGEAKRAGVVVIHENRGLVPHIKDVARRVALEGYMVLAPDALSPLGGTPADVDQARALFQKLDGPSNVKNFVAALKYLKTNPQSTGKVACMGFCWGGGVTNQVAVASPDLAVAVPFYGMQPQAEDVPRIKAAMLIHYGGDDARIDAGIPAFEGALKAAKIDYRIYIYEGAKHAFFNDTNPQTYNKAAAELAWQRTVAFFKERLR